MIAVPGAWLAAPVRKRPRGPGGSSPSVAAVHDPVYLQPGQLFVSQRPASVTTILGSCVAVCLWDPFRRAEGMNHFVLPDVLGAGPASPRFADEAVSRLIAKLVALGSAPSHLEAKLFGGACVLHGERTGPHLGARNVAAARRLLEAAGIVVMAEDVGGSRGRKLVFQTDDGVALVRPL
jgi:chemotaxis protein CheD